MVNNEQEIEQKLSQASPMPGGDGEIEEFTVHEHGEDEFYDPEQATSQ